MSTNQFQEIENKKETLAALTGAIADCISKIKFCHGSNPFCTVLSAEIIMVEILGYKFRIEIREIKMGDR